MNLADAGKSDQCNPATLQFITDAAKLIGVYEQRVAEQSIQLRELSEVRRKFLDISNEIKALRDHIAVQAQDYTDLLEIFETKCIECVLLKNSLSTLRTEQQKMEIQIRMATKFIAELRQDLE